MFLHRILNLNVKRHIYTTRCILYNDIYWLQTSIYDERMKFCLVGLGSICLFLFGFNLLVVFIHVFYDFQIQYECASKYLPVKNKTFQILFNQNYWPDPRRTRKTRQRREVNLSQSYV